MYALNGVSFTLKEGDTLGLVGESGCGKSTLGRTLMRLYEPTEGSIVFQGRDIAKLSNKELMPFRREMAMVFQDPYASLNPRMTVSDVVSAPMRAHGVGSAADRRGRVAELLDVVGLRAQAATRYPHEFSGGQRQRVGIARALAMQPKLLIADEPVSALDVSIRAQVVNLMMRLKEKFRLTYVFIAHDLSIVEYISTHVAVMYLGHVMEKASKDLYASPKHPYTQALIAANLRARPAAAPGAPDPQRRDPQPPAPAAGVPSHPLSVGRRPLPLRSPRLARRLKGGDEHLVACHLVKE